MPNEGSASVITEVITAIVGLVLGVITGFFFESRSTKSAERQNEQLRQDLENLRSMVYSLGGDPDRAVLKESVQDLSEAVRARALATQDASGQVGRQTLIAYFVRRGSTSSEVEAALADLSRTGFMREDGRWLRIQ